MTLRARFTQADVTRLLKGGRAAGFHRMSVHVEPDGSLKLFTEAGNAEAGESDFDRWMREDARRWSDDDI